MVIGRALFSEAYRGGPCRMREAGQKTATNPPAVIRRIRPIASAPVVQSVATAGDQRRPRTCPEATHRPRAPTSSASSRSSVKSAGLPTPACSRSKPSRTTSRAEMTSRRRAPTFPCAATRSDRASSERARSFDATPSSTASVSPPNPVSPASAMRCSSSARRERSASECASSRITSAGTSGRFAR